MNHPRRDVNHEAVDRSGMGSTHDKRGARPRGRPDRRRARAGDAKGRTPRACARVAIAILAFAIHCAPPPTRPTDAGVDAGSPDASPRDTGLDARDTAVFDAIDADAVAQDSDDV